MGSLVAAVASYVDAKAHSGQWLMRIEDLDPPRESPEAKALIPKQLEAHELLWDGEMTLQSQHSERYEQALAALREAQVLFPCSCSRKQLAEQEGLHLGRCTTADQQSTQDVKPIAWRLAMPNETWSFEDRIYGHQSQQLLHEVGDQVLKRKDGLYAYQLAVVVDDYHSGITQVVRGADLLDNTLRQLYLQQCLGYPQPTYMHLPLVINDQGQKLSKQNQAKALDLNTPEQNLHQALTFLNQQPPAMLANESCSSQLQWAIEHWDIQKITPSNAGII